MTPLERAARALAETYNRHRIPGAPDNPGADPVDYEDARAVLRAIREPSEGMVQVGCSGGDWPYAADTWSAMIYAALEEG